MTDWSALEEAAGALRRLNRTIATRRIDDESLLEVAGLTDALAQRLGSMPRRDKGADMDTFADLTAAMAGTPLPVAIGESLEFDPFSTGGGRLHPSSVGMDIRRVGDEAVEAVVRIDGMFQGPADRAHGGVLAVVIDELMGTVNRMIGRRAFTARLSIDYRAAAPIDTELTFRAWVQERAGRKITLRAIGVVDGSDPFVEAEALFVAPRPGAT